MDRCGDVAVQLCACGHAHGARDDVMRLDNCNFLERLQDWVQEQNRKGVTLTDAEFISLTASDGGSVRMG